ncbi:MAG: pentapeptide repeat-containing protein [Rhodospirillales bacterium]|nr:pentapeptide repeat-containing protein [Rhodospirillales bacterium]
MDQKQTLALFKKGPEAWNEWANDMLAKRKALEENGKWRINVPNQPITDETKKWLEDARAIFSSSDSPERFPDGTSFNGWLFPSVSTWEVAIFEGSVTFNAVTFSGNASFDSATFSGIAWFYETTFAESTKFREANFLGDALFKRTTFSGDARFNDAIFLKGAVFDETSFMGDASFSGSTFSERAGFRKATFEGNARFNSACFEKPANFSQVKFITEASFNSAQIKQAFDLSGACFSEVPDFRQTHCEEAPLLDDVHIDSIIIKQGRLSDEPDFTVTANYRALKRLAIQGHDHKHEVDFFAEQLRTRRLMVDTPSDPNWWLSFLFEEFSDYGRSIASPLCITLQWRHPWMLHEQGTVWRVPVHK